MKKLFALLLALVMVFGLGVTAYAEDNTAAMDELIAAAKEEGSLVVYGSCEEEYLAAACQNFQKLYGIKTDYQRLSTGEVPAKIEEENGKPSADVWFGGTNNPYDDAAAKGLLEQYDAMNAVHLMKDMYKNPDGYWYGIYTGLLGFMVNRDELDRKGLEVPQTWDDLLKPEYKGLIWLSNYKTAGTPKLVANLMIQLKGHDEGIQYPARPRTSAPVSASSASVSCMTASPRSSTTAMRTSSWSCRRTAPPARSDRSPSSRVRPIRTPQSSLLSMPCLRTALSSPRRTAPISSWSSTMPSSRMSSSNSAWIPAWSGTAMTSASQFRIPPRTSKT